MNSDSQVQILVYFYYVYFHTNDLGKGIHLFLPLSNCGSNNWALKPRMVSPVKERNLWIQNCKESNIKLIYYFFRKKSWQITYNKKKNECVESHDDHDVLNEHGI